MFIAVRNHSWSLNNIKYDGSGRNVISVCRIMAYAGYSVKFSRDQCEILDANETIIAVGPRVDDVYYLTE